MWVFMSDAFLSIVADQDDPCGDRLLVRARFAGDIEKAFPGAEIFSKPNADYAFRAWIPRDEVALRMAMYVSRLHYTNFKSSIKSRPLHDAAMRCWEIMFSFQNRMLRPFRGVAHTRWYSQGYNDDLLGDEQLHVGLSRPAPRHREGKIHLWASSGANMSVCGIEIASSRLALMPAAVTCKNCIAAMKGVK